MNLFNKWPDEVFKCVCLLTGKVDWLLQMHHGDIGLFGSSVILSVNDNTIDSSGLNFSRVDAILSMKTENSQPELNVQILPVEKN